MDRLPTVDTGILGVVQSDPEVIAVFPEMSATILPHSQEIRFMRGDSLDIGIQLQDDSDPPNESSLSNSVLRWAAKQGHGASGNQTALVMKTSYDADQIEIINEVKGQAVIRLYPDDTRCLPAVNAMWDLEITKPRSVVEIPSGMVLFTEGSDVVMSITPGLDWSALRLKRGDIFCAQGRKVLVREVLSVQHLRLEWSEWTSATAVTSDIAIHRGKTKTVAYGSFVPISDVVR